MKKKNELNGHNPGGVFIDDTISLMSRSAFKNTAIRLSAMSGLSFQVALDLLVSSTLNPPTGTDGFLRFVAKHNAMVEAQNKGTVVRKGDYVWIGGKKKLWRKLSKSERKWAEEEMEQDEINKHGKIEWKK